MHGIDSFSIQSTEYSVRNTLHSLYAGLVNWWMHVASCQRCLRYLKRLSSTCDDPGSTQRLRLVGVVLQSTFTEQVG